ncbi:unnamed protein product [Prunus brigantina]
MLAFCLFFFIAEISRSWRCPAPPGAMNLLNWSCQGLGNLWTIEALWCLVCNEDPKIVFLCETRCSKSVMESVCLKLGFRQCIVVESNDASGGLCLMWIDELAVSLRYASNNHIDTEVEVLGVQRRWRFTGFYGCPDTVECYHSWDLLIRLGATNLLPWLCCGDFSKILTAE